jgi:tRNA(Arg) A34 adenosine deaminase TadA
MTEMVKAGPCAKQVVVATIVAVDGSYFMSTNYCISAQASCPRTGMKTGEGYELCKSVCNQPAHAEINTLKAAGNKAKGGKLYITGHTYACDSCKQAAKEAGIVEIIIGSAPPPPL